jgi:hypothetical protein
MYGPEDAGSIPLYCSDLSPLSETHGCAVPYFSRGDLDENVIYRNVASCPDCSGGLIRQGGCFFCPDCGYQSCGS